MMQASEPLRAGIIRHMPDGTITISVYKDGECIAEQSGITSEDFALSYCIRYKCCSITNV